MQTVFTRTKSLNLILLVATFAASFSYSLSSGAAIRPVANLGFEAGGDKMAQIVYTDGSKSDLSAGDAVAFNGGMVIPVTELSSGFFEAQTTLGFKFKSTKRASNAEITWSRLPLEALGMYRNSMYNFRVGGGLAYSLNNELSGSGLAQGINVKFKNAVGLVLEADWMFGQFKQAAVGLRYLNTSYEAESAPIKFNGSSIGINFTYIFGGGSANESTTPAPSASAAAPILHPQKGLKRMTSRSANPPRVLPKKSETKTVNPTEQASSASVVQ